MKYKVTLRKNPLNRSEEKFYPAPVHEGRVQKSELVKEIVNISALSRGDVSSTIENMIDVIPKYLTMGKSVDLDELGSLRLSFSSSGEEDPKNVSAKNIKSVRVIFTPSPALRKALMNIRFEKASE